MKAAINLMAIGCKGIIVAAWTPFALFLTMFSVQSYSEMRMGCPDEGNEAVAWDVFVVRPWRWAIKRVI